MIEVTIDEPIWGAGCPGMFGWQQHGYGRMGVGIREDILRRHDKVKVNFNKGSIKSVEIDTYFAIELSEAYKSSRVLKGGIKLLIVPILAFKVLREKDFVKEVVEWEAEKFPPLSVGEINAMRKLFSNKNEEEAIEIGKKSGDEFWETFIAGKLEEADKIGKRINYWRYLYQKKYALA